MSRTGERGAGEALPTTVRSTACSCGCAGVHVIARRKTYDDVVTTFWSDGSVTVGLGVMVRGAGVARYACERRFNVAASWLLAEEVCFYNAKELPALVAAARRAARQTSAGIVPVRPIFRHLLRRAGLAA